VGYGSAAAPGLSIDRGQVAPSTRRAGPCSAGIGTDERGLMKRQRLARMLIALSGETTRSHDRIRVVARHRADDCYGDEAPGKSGRVNAGGGRSAFGGSDRIRPG
jgi:hypothetical protein